MEDMTLIISGGLSMLILEGIKWFIQKIGKKPEFGFSTNFYLVMLPVLNALVPFALVGLGLQSDAPILALTWVEVVKYVLAVGVSSLISVGGYNITVKSLKDKATEMKALRG